MLSVHVELLLWFILLIFKMNLYIRSVVSSPSDPEVSDLIDTVQ